MLRSAPPHLQESTRDFYRCSTPVSTSPKRLGTPAVTVIPVVKEAASCSARPLDSDSSSVYSRSSTDYFESSSEVSSSDDEPSCRSRAFAVKLARLDFWLARTDLSSADQILARSYGLRLINFEERYEIRYEQSRECVKTPKFVESDDVRNERITDRLARALDDFAAQRRTASHDARRSEAQRALPYAFVARPHSWPAQSHARTLLVPSPASPALDLGAARAVVRLSSGRRDPILRKSGGLSKVKSNALLRETLDRGVRPVYHAYKLQRQQARAAVRLASVAAPAARGCALASVVAPGLKRRGPPRKVASVNLPATTARVENATPASKTPLGLGLGRPSTMPTTPRPRMPVATRLGTAAGLVAAAGPTTRTMRPRKSYGDIQPRRPPLRA